MLQIFLFYVILNTFNCLKIPLKSQNFSSIMLSKPHFKLSSCSSNSTNHTHNTYGDLVNIYNYSGDSTNSNSNANLDFLLNLYNDVKFWREIFIVIGAIITVLGITLNTMCIIVFYKSKLFRNSSFPYYVYVLSIVDTLNLTIRYIVPQLTENFISGILVSQYNATTDFDYSLYTPEIVSDLHCNIFMYIHNALGFASTWIMAAVSVERWLVIKYPLQTKSIINLRALFILLSILLIVLVINVFDFSSGLYAKPEWFSNLTLLCEPIETHENLQLGFIQFNAEALTFLRIILQAIGPFIVALFFNSLIIHNFKRIKTTALGMRSNSTVSVMSPSLSSNVSPNISNKRNNGTNTNIILQSQLYGSTLMPPLVTAMQTNNDTLTSNGTNLQTSHTNVSLTQSTQQQNNNQPQQHQHHHHHKYSFKRRLSKLKLNRETDVMLIVLSFTILVTQLPCTITWYLIYYRLMLQYINDVYLAAHTPVLMYILRLIEMLYFSLNFIFYITLSPSLRKELKLNPAKFFKCNFFKTSLNKRKQKYLNNKGYCGKSNNKIKIIIEQDLNINGNAEDDVREEEEQQQQQEELLNHTDNGLEFKHNKRLFGSMPDLVLNMSDVKLKHVNNSLDNLCKRL